MALTDEELVLLINGQGHVQSAEMSQLIYRWSRVIRIKAAKHTNGAELDDLIQEGFLGLLSAIRNYLPERGSFSSFADTCIENRMKSAVAKAGKGYTAETDYDFEQLSDEHTLTEDYIILKDGNSELYKKLEKLLSKREFEVLRLYLAGYSYKEIAGKLSIPLKSVDNSLTRSRQKLKKLL